MKNLLWIVLALFFILCNEKDLKLMMGKIIWLFTKDFTEG